MRRALLLGLVGLLLPLRPATAVPIPAPSIDYVNEDCDGMVPPALHVPVVDPADEITIGLALVLDRGVTEQRAAQIIERAQAAYAPLHLRLDVKTVQSATLSGTDADSLIDQSLRLLPDMKPAHVDAVLTLTSVDVTSLGFSGVAGKVDCVGGARFRHQGGAVIEVRASDDAAPLGPLRLLGSISSKILAHELGHLLAAHHHYANCGEGSVGLLELDVNPCTLMFNDVGAMGLRFGAVEAAVIRGFSDRYLRP